jgi:transcriptional regulator with XRE-family HTH domain
MPTVELITGEQLQARREALGLTQAAFAKLAGVSTKTISNYESKDLVSGRTRRQCRHAITLEEEAQKPNSNSEDFPWLRLETKRWSKDNCGPASLLRPEFEIVPFHGTQRLSDLESLSTWCKGDSKFSARAYIADGGFGKSRLARELCHWARKRGWIAGFAEPEDFRSGQMLESALAALKTPMLIVVDYAGDREKVPMLERILKASGDCKAPCIRVLMLDRDSLWLSRLEALLGTDDRLAAGGVTRQPWKLDLKPAAPDEAERKETYKIAATVFSDRLGSTPLVAPSDLADGEVYQNLLMIHARALVSPKRKTGPSRDTSILDALLDRERNYWRKRLDAIGGSRLLLSKLEEAEALINLRRGAKTADAARSWLVSYKPFRGLPQDSVEAILSVLRECYPLGTDGIGPLQPDLLREHFRDVSFAKYPSLQRWITKL